MQVSLSEAVRAAQGSSRVGLIRIVSRRDTGSIELGGRHLGGRAREEGVMKAIMEMRNVAWSHFRVLPMQEHIFANINLNYRDREILQLLEI